MAHIKKKFDKKYNPTRRCVVGRNFGSYVTHETKHFIYLYLGQVAILLFNLVESMGCDPSKNKDCSLNSKSQRLNLQSCLKEHLDLEPLLCCLV